MKSLKIFIESLDLKLFLTQWRQVFRLPFHILNVPFQLEMLSLLVCSRKGGCLAACCALNCLFLSLLLLFGQFLFFVLHFLLLFLFSSLLFFLNAFQKLQSTKLLGLKLFVFLINDNSHQYFNSHLVHFFANLSNLSIFVGFYVVDSEHLGSFDLLLLYLIDIKSL